MENKNRNISGKTFLLRIGTALLIVAVCILFILHLFDVIQFSFINNIRFKAAFTIVSSIAVIFYFFINYRKRKIHLIGWKELIFYSFYFEAIGSWWSESLLGSVSILLGVGFLILGLFIMYKRGL